MGRFPDNKDRRDDTDALYCNWCTGVAGVFSGKFGTIENILTVSGGFPALVSVREGLASSRLFTANYSDLRPASRPVI
jgi:hypothetical protein